MDSGKRTPQMSTQMELPLHRRGESLVEQRSEERAPANQGNERSGTAHLMERVAAYANLREAMKRVRKNRGSPGVDGMTVDEIEGHLDGEMERIRERLLTGRYRPSPIRQVQIPKPGGGVRELGIPTVLDRVIQQALLQVLQPRFDLTFSSSSYGFRPGRSAHQAILAAQKHVREGRLIVVDTDLAKFFDRVNHDVLMGRLAKRIDDRLVLGLIRRFLQAGMMANGVVMSRVEGTPQGGPLSPLLANVLLDDVDKVLEARGHAFVRYADDLNVYVRSQRAGERVLALLRRLFEGLRLKVNEEKSAVARVNTRKFLGFSLRIRRDGRVYRRIAPEAVQRFKTRVRKATRRNTGRSIDEVIDALRVFMPGWKNYFRLAETPYMFIELDQWIRHRLRALLAKHRAPRAKIGWWRWTLTAEVKRTWPNRFFDDRGLPRLAA